MTGAGQQSATSLAFERVTCIRGGRTLFADMSLSLGPGEVLLVTGNNGVGKSSLLRLAAGLLRPAAGTLTSSGGAALADDRLALDPMLSLGRALAFWAALDRRPVFTGLGLAAILDVPVRMLSTGQQRRAGLARVVQSGAAIWLLDEPINGLDGGSIGEVERAIAEHRRAGGIAVVASHQPLDLPDAKLLHLGAPTA